jgi:acyl carrier protein
MAKSKEEITEVLLDAVAKATKRNAADLNVDMKWVEDLNFKSVQGMKVAGLLNYKLGITVPLAALIECTTLGDAVDMLDGLVNA